MLKENTYLFKDMKDEDELSKIVEAVKFKFGTLIAIIPC